jgi:hypothetical protein
MQELLVDFITSLDGYGAAEGWPGWCAPRFLRAHAVRTARRSRGDDARRNSLQRTTRAAA